MSRKISNFASFDDSVLNTQKMLEEVRAGLSATPKTLPCKYLYDETGSDLFRQICDLPEYYPTRTEIDLLTLIAPEISELIGSSSEIIEYGAGSSEKIKIVLSALIEPKSYTAVDISKKHLLETTRSLSEEFPGLIVHGIAADFMQPFAVPEMLGDRARVGFFPGSTIGNLSHIAATKFLQGTRKAVGTSGSMLIGVDLKKDEGILNSAYNDSLGITAAFNMNLLVRLNRELGINFKLDQFRHKAFYNSRKGRVEMHLVSLQTQKVTLENDIYSFKKYQTIHTENSYKYELEEFKDLANGAGYETIMHWTDPDALFAIFFLQSRATVV